jgi:hypothetical protein
VPLSDKQVAYCARDAWAGAAIVEELIARDPDTFSPDSLKCLLENQQSVEEMTVFGDGTEIGSHRADKSHGTLPITALEKTNSKQCAQGSHPPSGYYQGVEAEASAGV